MCFHQQGSAQTKAQPSLSSLIYLLLLCLMTAGGAYRYTACYRDHTGKYRNECEEVMSGLDNYTRCNYMDVGTSLLSRSHLEQETDYFGSGFLLNQITAKICILDLKSADFSKIPSLW